MSPQTGMVLMEEVVPRLKATMQSVKPVGAEDVEELLQDAICVAATMLDALERRGKTVTPGNVVYYTTLHMRSGRRSYSAGRTDAMNPGTALDGKSCVLSFEEPAGIDSETGEEIPLGDLLSAHQDDPSMTASRTIDWEAFLATRNPRYAGLVCDLASGKNTMEAAKHSRQSYFVVRQLKARLAEDLREFMGERALADAMKIPAWRGNIMADHEKCACRADRRHS